MRFLQHSIFSVCGVITVQVLAISFGLHRPRLRRFFFFSFGKKVLTIISIHSHNGSTWKPLVQHFLSNAQVRKPKVVGNNFEGKGVDASGLSFSLLGKQQEWKSYKPRRYHGVRIEILDLVFVEFWHCLPHPPEHTIFVQS